MVVVSIVFIIFKVFVTAQRLKVKELSNIVFEV